MSAITYLDYDYSVGRDWRRHVWPYIGQYGEGSEHRNRFWPAIDQLDWDNGGLVPFAEFFKLPSNGRYYDVCYGPLHLFFIDAAAAEPDGKTASSKQARWLQTKLLLSTARWKVVVTSSPPWSSDANTQDADLQWPYDEWGADLVVSGESFDYERFSVNRFPYIVNGLGGNLLFSPVAQLANSMRLYAGNFGAGRVMVNKDTLRYEFFTIDGTLIDSFQLTKGKSTMRPSIPSPSAVGSSANLVHGPWANPNGNVTPPSPGDAAIYYQDNSNPVNEWNWNITNQNWVVSASTAGANSDMVYTNDPNTEGLVPSNPQLPCTAYSQSGSGAFYGWNVTQQKWV